MIELKMVKVKTMKLKDVPIGGIFIADNKDFFSCETRVGKQAYIKRYDDGDACYFDDIDGKCIAFIGRGEKDVVFTGEVRKDWIKGEGWEWLL